MKSLCLMNSDVERSRDVSCSQMVQVAESLIHVDVDDPSDGDATKFLCPVLGLQCSPGKNTWSSQIKGTLGNIAVLSKYLFVPASHRIQDIWMRKDKASGHRAKIFQSRKVLPHSLLQDRTYSRVLTISQGIPQQRLEPRSPYNC